MGEVFSAHPRAYGENPASSIGNNWGYGSSPRIRGKHLATSRNTQPKT